MEKRIPAAHETRAVSPVETSERDVLIRETRALDPMTKKPCPARVLQRGNEVYLEKELASGERQRVLVERDAEFYRRFAHPKLAGKHRILNHFLFATDHCNLSCPVCYEGTRRTDEPTGADIEQAVAGLRKQRIHFCGGEPTCRDDLPELIRSVYKHNGGGIMTNGLRLADKKYLQTLRDAGLTCVIFSMNGLNDDVYRETNGEALLDVKLQALKNMIDLDMIVLLSATITRGLNEDQIGPLIELEGEHPAIRQVRFRSMAEVGAYVEGGNYCMSDFLKLVCREGGVDYELWCRQQDFLNHLRRIIGVDHIRPRHCAMRADLTKDLVPFASDWDSESWDSAVLEKPRIVARVLRDYGPTYALQYLYTLTQVSRYTPHPGFRRIAVRVWPTLDTIDLDLNRRCSSIYLRDGERLPFCLSNILGT